MDGSLARILRRGPLVAAGVGLVQALILALGWLLLHQTTNEHVAQGVEDIILTGNAAAARSIADALDSREGGLEYGSPAWEHAQSIIEKVELASGGFACLLDREGFIVCHPEIRTSPGLRSVNLADEAFVSLADGASRPLASLADGVVASGTMRFTFDGKHYVSTYRDSRSGLQLLVHQPVSGLTAAGRHVTAGLITQMLLVGAAIFALTAVLGFVFFRAHNGEVLRWNGDLERRVFEQTRELLRSHEAILFGIAKLSEYRDNETGLHVERMCAYSVVLARQLRQTGAPIDERWIGRLEVAASLHDIGKVSIPDAILLKPGRLTEREFEIMKTHVEAGEEALLAVRDRIGHQDLLEMGIEITSGHHERWDGTGYPRGLAGEDIPLAARIVAVADVFDALMSKRVYKPSIPFEDVVQIIEEGRGSHFDPAIVDAFHVVKFELRDVRARLQDLSAVPSLLPHREVDAVAAEA